MRPEGHNVLLCQLSYVIKIQPKALKAPFLRLLDEMFLFILITYGIRELGQHHIVSLRPGLWLGGAQSSLPQQVNVGRDLVPGVGGHTATALHRLSLQTCHHSETLSLVHIQVNTKLWLVGLWYGFLFTHKDTAKATKSPIFGEFLAFRCVFIA